MASSKTVMASQVGTTKIHYFPEKKIGKGTTSIVYQGYFGNVAIKTAVKEIEKHNLEVFDREVKVFIEILANAFETSRNVVGLYDWGETKDYFYFSMERADFNLRQFINQNPSQETLIKIIEDAAHGLEFLHDKNILHRDIKPENVLIFQNNVNVLAKLGDFGVSRQMSNAASTNSRGRGTENWMAPEAIIAKHKDELFQTTKYVDIFSLGMTSYFTLSKGEHPFGHSTVHGRNETMNIIDLNIQPVTLIQTTKDYAIHHLLAWMMQKIPANRPNIKQVVTHPMFWGSRKSLDFICELSSTVSDKYTAECKQIRDNVESAYQIYYNGLYHKHLNWILAVDNRLFQRTGRGNKKYYGDSLFSLVELIRDKDEHFKEMLPDLMQDRFMVNKQGTWEYSKKKYIEYYMELFPDLLIFLFCWFVDQDDFYFASFREVFYNDYNNINGGQIKNLL